MSPLTPKAFFGETGLLSRALPGYEPRPQQIEMAERVLSALCGPHPLLVEAGTGTGKTLAYLVPAVLSGQRVVISTGTRHLQEQLFHKDLPLLASCLPVPFTAVRLKGIANYLCLRRYHDVISAARLSRGQKGLPGLPSAATFVDPLLHDIAEWRDRTETGDRAELPQLHDDSPLWLEVSATSETRLGSRCAYFERCFVTRARRAAQQAQLIIVNHHLLCADLAVRATFPDARLLPPYDALICDEAHQMEEIATDYFSVTVSERRLHALLRDLRRAAVEGAVPRDTEGGAAQAERQAEQLFSALRQRLGEKGPGGIESGRIGLHAEHVLSGPQEAALHLDTALEQVQGQVLRAGHEGKPDSAGVPEQFYRRVQALRDDLALIMDGAQRPSGRHVFWMEVGAKGDVALHASPVDVAATLQKRLYPECPAVVLTSATLAPEGRFDFVRARLGIGEADELCLASPFDYPRQARLYLPDDLPEPGEPGFLLAACERMAQLVALTGGRAFLLFTSLKRMQQAHRRLRPLFARHHRVLCQGEAPKHLLLQRFAQSLKEEGRGAVLFATSSFWEGVDVVGEALQLVVIDKLPFMPPDDPILAARCRRLEEEGQDSFAAYQVPRAALALAQGFGRLIRHRGDRGIVTLLDRRAQERAYGERVLSALPKTCPRVRRFQQVEEFVNSWGR